MMIAVSKWRDVQSFTKIFVAAVWAQEGRLSSLAT